MALYESGEMYLETILILSKKSPCVRSIDICEQMGFSKPSVSRAVGLLKEAELINVDKNKCIVLTDEGRKIAEKTYERHNVLTEFFVKLGVSEETASVDACKIEHDISDEGFEAIKSFLASD